VHVPARSDFVEMTSLVTTFPWSNPPRGSPAELNDSPYGFVIGTPQRNAGVLADAIRAAYNALINVDEQVISVIPTSGLTQTTVVVAGPIIDKTSTASLGRMWLRTPACHGTTLPVCPVGPDGIPRQTAASGPCCDDYERMNTDGSRSYEIVAGVNGVAETTALPASVQDFDIRITSGWRNPERNENYCGARRSRHQFGVAIDLNPAAVGDPKSTGLNAPPGYTIQQLRCILSTAARRAMANVLVQTEIAPPDETNCDDQRNTHVHAHLL
jgi:hypothetical protein